MKELNKQIDYVTEVIHFVCEKYPKNNEKQYKGFITVLKKANPHFTCSEERYVGLKKLLARYMFDRNLSDRYAYEQNVSELLGFYMSISVL
ncbi:hypothetical protein ABWK24_02415 [Priestia megaterium]|uniref:hypothetical protein n=1 Tax=Priestia megaterium TaxID=1404 RepID=UPI00339B1C3C